MKYEVKIGLLSVIALALFIWGYKFLAGKNLLTGYTYVYVKYENVDNLTKSSTIKVNGFTIGTVTDVSIDLEDNNSIIVEMQIDEGVKLPKDAIAVIVPEGMMGRKFIRIDNMHDCDDCAVTYDYITGGLEGMISSLVVDSELQHTLDVLKNGIMGIVDTLQKDPVLMDANGRINKNFKKIETIIDGLGNATHNLNKILNTSPQIVNMIKNLDEVTQGVKDNGGKINSIIENIEQITKDLKETNLKNTIANADKSMKDLQSVFVKTETSLKELNGILAGLNRGDGSAGKLLTDEKLYDNLNKATRELNLLLQDFRLNPKRYVNVSVFGKKQKEYKVPEDDPANK